MPAHEGSDSKGPYIQWGSQKKYYYKKNDKKSKAAAWKKATAQGSAIKRAGYKGNDMKIQKMLVNFTGSIRYDEMMGRKYLVAPMSMITEGVHAGSDGPLFYPSEELFKTPQVWNHKPVVVYHPGKNGEGVSACDPVILSNRQVGVIMNARKGEVTVDGEKVPALLAEAWLEEERMDKVDERIAEAVEKNQMMELSTGLFTDNERAEKGAEWNGEKYDAVARNYRPDHLALLPDLKGACSIEDGAGFLRLNALPGKIVVTGNAMSHGNVRSLLNSWLQDKDTGGEVYDTYVEAVYDDFFIYLDGGKYYKYDYSLKDNQVVVEGSAEEVVRVTEFRTKTGEFVGNKNNVNERKESIMTKKKIVDALIKSNGNSWGEDDRETLTSLDDGVLEKMQASEKVAADAAVENAVEKYRADEKAKADKIEADKLTANANTANKPKTLKEHVASLPKEVQAPLQNMMKSYDAIKTALVKRLTDNEKCQFSEEQLKTKEVDELRRLVALASTGEPEVPDELDFSGQGIEPTGNVENVEPLLMPAVMGATPVKSE